MKIVNTVTSHLTTKTVTFSLQAMKMKIVTIRPTYREIKKLLIVVLSLIQKIATAQ